MGEPDAPRRSRLTQCRFRISRGIFFVIDQNKCSFTKVFPIGETKLESEAEITFIDVTSSGVNITCSNVGTCENGDKAFARCTGKAGPGGTSSGKWWFTGGTGRLQGLKGGGTFQCKEKSPEPGSAHACDFTWTYKLPAPKKP